MKNKEGKLIIISQSKLTVAEKEQQQQKTLQFSASRSLYKTYIGTVLTILVSSTSWACCNCIKSNPKTVLVPKGLVIVIMDHNWLHLVYWPASDNDKCHWKFPILSLLPTNCMTFQKNCIYLSQLSYVFHC